MTVIRIAERDRSGEGPFAVRLSFGDEASYDAQVADPADAAEEARLAWYFEEHLRYPFLDSDKERLAVEHLTRYGQALFDQVFADPGAQRDYRNLRARSFDGCRIEVSGSAALHRLHWEALRDPDLPDPLAVRLPITRRVEALGSRFDLPGPQPTLNICVVTARPDGPRDVGYRTISRPLLDALRTANLPVAVDLVRPGAWEALRGHLRETTARRGSGWYQVIHFDLHGSFSDYAELEQGRRDERLLFSPGMVSEFAGSRGFLYFETDEEGKAEPVPAEQVAALLAEHRIPVAVLNACQSAQQSADEAGLAQRLAEAGAPVAVGMAYSVTVSAGPARDAGAVCAADRGRRPGRGGARRPADAARPQGEAGVLRPEPGPGGLAAASRVQPALVPRRAAGHGRRRAGAVLRPQRRRRRRACHRVRVRRPGPGRPGDRAPPAGGAGRQRTAGAGHGRGREVHAAETPGLVVAADRPGGPGVPLQLRGPGLDREPDRARHPAETVQPG